MKVFKCSRCPQVFKKYDMDLIIRILAHEKGRHTHHSVMGERPYQKHLMSKSGMGGLDIGPVEWTEIAIDE